MDLGPLVALLLITAYFLAFKLLLGSAVLGIVPLVALFVLAVVLGLLLSLTQRSALPAVSSIISSVYIFLMIFSFLPLALGIDLVLGA